MRAEPRTTIDGRKVAEQDQADVRTGADSVGGGPTSMTAMDYAKQYAPEVGAAVGLGLGLLVGGMALMPAALGAAAGGVAGYAYQKYQAAP